LGPGDRIGHRPKLRRQERQVRHWRGLFRLAILGFRRHLDVARRAGLDPRGEIDAEGTIGGRQSLAELFACGRDLDHHLGPRDSVVPPVGNRTERLPGNRGGRA
jgi:hypothetical protein